MRCEYAMPIIRCERGGGWDEENDVVLAGTVCVVKKMVMRRAVT